MLDEDRLLVNEALSVDPKGAGGDAAQAELAIDFLQVKLFPGLGLLGQLRGGRCPP